jgi:hypothetical protein
MHTGYTRYVLAVLNEKSKKLKPLSNVDELQDVLNKETGKVRFGATAKCTRSKRCFLLGVINLFLLFLVITGLIFLHCMK